jgi:2-dehydro-3-deoxyphosphogluconate aldolase / (4S)-4-hydroxy-2-oxoglutarate aldolase
MLVGAGTVLSPRQVTEAREAGAHFVVSPGSNPRVVDACLEQGIPIFPGVCTPTEVEAVLEKGIHVVKFFPAEPMGGVAFLRALAGPYTTLEFMPTGGIGAANVGDYLTFRKVVACGGSWMAPTEWIRAKQFDRIREETERSVAAVRAFSEEQ